MLLLTGLSALFAQQEDARENDSSSEEQNSSTDDSDFKGSPEKVSSVKRKEAQPSTATGRPLTKKRRQATECPAVAVGTAPTEKVSPSGSPFKLAISTSYDMEKINVAATVTSVPVPAVSVNPSTTYSPAAEQASMEKATSSTSQVSSKACARRSLGLSSKKMSSPKAKSEAFKPVKPVAEPKANPVTPARGVCSSDQAQVITPRTTGSKSMEELGSETRKIFTPGTKRFATPLGGVRLPSGSFNGGLRKHGLSRRAPVPPLHPRKSVT